MLRLRISAEEDDKAVVISHLKKLDGVHRVTVAPSLSEDNWVVSADLTPKGADLVFDAITELNIPDHKYVMVHQEMIAPQRDPGHSLATDQGFAWAEVLGSARANSRPIGRYVLLMIIAGCIAAMGVISDNAILIVGAMAVSPDLLPICATSVALVGMRISLAGRAFATLAIGMMLVISVAALLAFAFKSIGLLGGKEHEYLVSLGPLVSADYATIVVALAAGIAGILSFETKAAAAVGVAISITTVPASAYFGVACGLGVPSEGWGALATLGINVSLMIIAGTSTLALQRWIPTRG